MTDGFLVLTKVNAPIRGIRPRKSYLAQIFQSPEQMLGTFSSDVFQRSCRLQCVLFDMLNKYFMVQIVENTFILH